MKFYKRPPETAIRNRTPIGAPRLTAMSDTYYVRSQGKVLGPYSFEDLKIKAGKGHLKKTHQVSTDKQNWHSARKMEGLFPPPPKPPEPAKQERPAASKTPAESDVIEVQLIDDGDDLEVVPAGEETEWHYCLQGDEQTRGPVTESQLRHLFQSGRLPWDTLIWNETFPDWAPAGRVPAFRSLATGGRSPRGGAAAHPMFADVEPGLPPQHPSERPTPPLASASLILGILGIIIPIGVGSVLAVIFGHLRFGRSNPTVKSTPGRGWHSPD